jgi:hypothetical protein
MNAVAPVAENAVRAALWQSQIHRDFGEALSAMGNEHEAAAHLTEAIAITNKLIQLAPSSLVVKRHRADALESFGRFHARHPQGRNDARALLNDSLTMWHDWVSRKIALPYSADRERSVALLLASLEKR